MRRIALSRLLVFFALLVPVAAAGVEVEDLVITDEKGFYTVQGRFGLAAPMDQVFRVITDYGQLSRLEEGIVESRLLETVDGQSIVHTIVRGCMLFICRDLVRVESVRETPPDEVLAELIPERSDMESQTTRWRLQAGGDGTIVRYDLQIRPGFFVPSRAMRRRLERGVLGTIRAVEKYAGAAVPGSAVSGSAGQ